MAFSAVLIAAALAGGAAQASPGPTPLPTPRPAAAVAGTGASTPRGKTLSEVARGVKLQLPHGESRVITNESLKSLGAGVELTTGTAVPPASAAAGGDELDAAEAQNKAHWQERYFAARRELDELTAEEARLTAEVARLERDFYSRDDPYQRDTVIKPAWDEAVIKLREVQKRLPAARKAPDEIANEARRAGALPGWFREAPPPAQDVPPGARPSEPR
jgi:hypothetical protein